MIFTFERTILILDVVQLLLVDRKYLEVNRNKIEWFCLPIHIFFFMMSSEIAVGLYNSESGIVVNTVASVTQRSRRFPYL